MRKGKKLMIANSCPLYQTYTPTVILKTQTQKWTITLEASIHPQPQTLQGKPVAKPETLLLITFGLVCKSDIKDVHCDIYKDIYEAVRYV